MSTTDTGRRMAVTIDFASVDEPDRVEGVVHAPDVEPRPFSGWMSLLEVLESVTAGVRR